MFAIYVRSKELISLTYDEPLKIKKTINPVEKQAQDAHAWPSDA